MSLGGHGRPDVDVDDAMLGKGDVGTNILIKGNQLTGGICMFMFPSLSLFYYAIIHFLSSFILFLCD